MSFTDNGTTFVPAAVTVAHALTSTMHRLNCSVMADTPPCSHALVLETQGQLADAIGCVDQQRGLSSPRHLFKTHSEEMAALAQRVMTYQIPLAIIEIAAALARTPPPQTALDQDREFALICAIVLFFKTLQKYAAIVEGPNALANLSGAVRSSLEVLMLHQQENAISVFGFSALVKLQAVYPQMDDAALLSRLAIEQLGHRYRQAICEEDVVEMADMEEFVARYLEVCPALGPMIQMFSVHATEADVQFGCNVDRDRDDCATLMLDQDDVADLADLCGDEGIY